MAQAASSTTRSLSGPAARILCVESNVELQRLFIVLCAGPRTLIECMSRASAALTRLIADPDAFDTLVVEEHGTGMNGLEFVSRALAAGFRGRIVLIGTAHSTFSAADAAEALAAVDLQFIAHPLNFHALQDLLPFPRGARPPRAHRGDSPYHRVRGGLPTLASS